MAGKDDIRAFGITDPDIVLKDLPSGPIGVIPVGSTKVQSEEMIRSLTGGDFPRVGDILKFTADGWVLIASPVDIGVGSAFQILQTNAGASAAEWSNFIDIPGFGKAQAWLEDLTLNLPSGDATPDVSNHQVWKTLGTTAITDFDNGVTGQRLSILAQGSITITHNASIIILKGSVNFNMVAGDTLELRMFNNQVWNETGRSQV